MEKQFQLKSYRICLSLFIFVATAMPLQAGVLVIAYMDESKVVLVEGTTYQYFSNWQKA